MTEIPLKLFNNRSTYLVETNFLALSSKLVCLNSNRFHTHLTKQPFINRHPLPNVYMNTHKVVPDPKLGPLRPYINVWYNILIGLRGEEWTISHFLYKRMSFCCEMELVDVLLNACVHKSLCMYNLAIFLWACSTQERKHNLSVSCSFNCLFKSWKGVKFIH